MERKTRISRMAAGRDVLVHIALYGDGATARFGGATAFALDFRRKRAEGDLSKIGNGKRGLLQMHDPRRAICTSLQKAARRALAGCDKDRAQSQP